MQTHSDIPTSEYIHVTYKFITSGIKYINSIENDNKVLIKKTPFGKKNGKDKKLPNNIEILLLTSKDATFVPESEYLSVLYIVPKHESNMYVRDSSQNKLFEGVLDYKNLQELVVENINFIKLINQAPKLKILVINNCSITEKLPDSDKLPKLEKLLMYRTFYEPKYKSLVELNIEHMPYSFNSLNLDHLDNLVKLTITACFYLQTIGDLPKNLQELVITSTNITKLPDSKVFINLKKFVFYNNNYEKQFDYSTFPQFLPSLEFLYCDNDKLPEFMPNLKILVIVNYHALGTFPTSLCSLQELFILFDDSFMEDFNTEPKYILPRYIGFTLKELYTRVNIHFFKDMFICLEGLCFKGVDCPFPTGLRTLKHLWYKKSGDTHIEDIENYNDVIENNPGLIIEEVDD